MSEHRVASVDEIPQGGCKHVAVDGIDIALFHLDGEFHAILDECPHKGASFSEIGKPKIGEELIEATKGGVDPEVPSIFCPWHHWEWNLESGRNTVVPSKRTRVFDTKVDGEDVLVVV